MSRDRTTVVLDGINQTCNLSDLVQKGGEHWQGWVEPKHKACWETLAGYFTQWPKHWITAKRHIKTMSSKCTHMHTHTQ